MSVSLGVHHDTFETGYSKERCWSLATMSQVRVFPPLLCWPNRLFTVIMTDQAMPVLVKCVAYTPGDANIDIDSTSSPSNV